MKGRAESRKDANIYASWIRRWWQPWALRTDFFCTPSWELADSVIRRSRLRDLYSRFSGKFVLNDTLVVFALDDDYSLASFNPDCTGHGRKRRAEGAGHPLHQRRLDDVPVAARTE